MKHPYTIETLLELMAERRDGELLFRVSAGATSSASLSGTLLILAWDCEQAVRELKDVVRQFGADPERDPSGLAAGLRRARVRPWSVFASGEDGAILEECERGASRLLEVYRNALDEHLPDWVRAVVLRQFEGLMASHDQIRNQRPIREILATSPHGAQTGQSHPD
jgi:uncharacterized protein (TIGR02284 family)